MSDDFQPEDGPRYDLTTPEGVRFRNVDATRRRIPARFRDAEPTNSEVLAWCGEFTVGRREGKPVPSLLLVGPTGTGKTTQAYAAIRRVTSNGGADWLATTGADLHARLRPRDGFDAEGEYQRWASVPLLMIDDFAAGKDSEWTDEVDYRITNHREAHLLPTIITTNLPLRAKSGPSLQSALSERVFSRLGKYKLVVLKGADRRLAS